VNHAEWAAIEQIVVHLQRRFRSVAPDTVTVVVHGQHARFDGRPVRDFVPLLVERRSERVLDQLAKSPAPDAKRAPRHLA
jgi:hypothetical protein